jgi:CRP/FNR family transcriptional regulator, cyclic AMP receptor protein
MGDSRLRTSIRLEPEDGFAHRKSCLLGQSNSAQPCNVQNHCLLCRMPPESMGDVAITRYRSPLPAHTMLFVEQEPPRGVFLLCDGEVKLSISSSAGRKQIISTAKSGEALGLMATLSGKPYETTAETICRSNVAFVRREHFLQFLAAHPETLHEAVKEISDSCIQLYEKLRIVGLTHSARGKVAKLLLTWSPEKGENVSSRSACLSLTHAEIAECAGVARETATRILNDFKSRGFIMVRDSKKSPMLTIANRPALEALASA